MWQAILEPRLKAGELVAIGVVQEQHPDRARLYLQWRRLDWPVVADALNELGHEAVPIPMGLDGNGRVLYPRLRPNQLDAFLAAGPAPGGPVREAPLPHPLAGDEAFHAGNLDAAIEAYRGVAGDPQALFRLGVALRRRFESGSRRPGDGQAAVDAWTRALALVPGQYIWRRRLQQYGPRLAKPYDFYGWVAKARAEIAARGEQPVALAVEPRGAELIGRGPAREAERPDPDPAAKLPRDESGLVELETIVTPARVPPGGRARVRLVFRVGKDGFWNNEADPLTITVRDGAGLKIGEGEFVHPAAKEPESREMRVLEFEVEAGADPGGHTVEGYAAYGACEKAGGVCRYLRRDFRITITVDPEAPSLR